MKKIISCLLFLTLLIISLIRVNEIALKKDLNRYLIMQTEAGAAPLENGTRDVIVFGSCHAYTSFHVPYYEENYKRKAYNFSNPGEFIPITYVQMAQKFRTEKPKVALVEIWGMMSYNTYVPYNKIISSYGAANLELLDFSKEKLEVIQDFEQYNLFDMEFRLARYKNQIVDQRVRPYDFDYTYKNLLDYRARSGDRKYYWTYFEMSHRLERKGSAFLYSGSTEDYNKLQASFTEEECEIESILMKYVEKIIDLCEKNGVQLMFYRAPYISNSNEIKKVNFLTRYLNERDIPFYDLEKLVDFDFTKDFHDYQHLTESGMLKATEYLADRIEELLES